MSVAKMIEGARVAFGAPGDLGRLEGWLRKKVADYRIASKDGFVVAEVLFREPLPSDNVQKLCNLQRKNFGFVRERSYDSFVPMTREEYGELTPEASTRQKSCGCPNHDREAAKMIVQKPATQWCPQQLGAFLNCRGALCTDPTVSPICVRMTGFRRVGRLANYMLYLELASHSAPRSTRVFAVSYIDATVHPNIRDCVERSGWRMADHVFEYSDSEGSDAWRTADSTASTPHPKRKQMGRLHPMALTGRKKRRV